MLSDIRVNILDLFNKTKTGSVKNHRYEILLELFVWEDGPAGPSDLIFCINYIRQLCNKYLTKCQEKELRDGFTYLSREMDQYKSVGPCSEMKY